MPKTLEYSHPTALPPKPGKFTLASAAAVFLMGIVPLIVSIPAMIFPGTGPGFADALALGMFAVLVSLLEILAIIFPSAAANGFLAVFLAGLFMCLIVNLRGLTTTGYMLFGTYAAVSLPAALGHFLWCRRLLAWKRVTRRSSL